MALRKKAVAVKEKFDARAIKASRSQSSERKLPRSLRNKFHTVNIAEQEGELPYVDVFVSGTVKDGKGNDMPFARNFQIQRGVDVLNVPAMVVHVLMDTAIETRFRQETRDSKDGGKRNVFIPFKKSSYPCTIVESYDEKKTVDESDEVEFQGSENEEIIVED